MSLSYWGFTSYLEVGSERYGFSNADHQTVPRVNTELCDISKYFQKFLYHYGYCKEITKCTEFNKCDYVWKLTWVENQVK